MHPHPGLAEFCSQLQTPKNQQPPATPGGLGSGETQETHFHCVLDP